MCTGFVPFPLKHHLIDHTQPPFIPLIQKLDLSHTQFAGKMETNKRNRKIVTTYLSWNGLRTFVSSPSLSHSESRLLLNPAPSNLDQQSHWGKHWLLLLPYPASHSDRYIGQEAKTEVEEDCETIWDWSYLYLPKFYLTLADLLNLWIYTDWDRKKKDKVIGKDLTEQKVDSWVTVRWVF